MIPKTSKVLVTTDLSDCGNRAIPYAYAVVDPGGEVHLVHLIEHQDIPSPLYSHYTSDELNLPEKRAEVAGIVEAELRNLIPEQAADKKVETRVDVVFHPHIGRGILKEIADRKVHMVVMGTHGHTALVSLLMGSVAEEVFNGSPVPVLSVPHK